MFKDIFEELSYKFKDLSTLKPDYIKSRLNFNNFINEDTVHDYNPKRYLFYLQFMQGLENPDIMKKIIYENKLISSSKEEEDEIINKIVNKLNNLYYIDPSTTISDNEYINKKNIKLETDSRELSNRIKKIYRNSNSDNSQYNSEVDRIIDDTFLQKKIEPSLGGKYNKKILGGLLSSEEEQLLNEERLNEERLMREREGEQMGNYDLNGMNGMNSMNSMNGMNSMNSMNGMQQRNTQQPQPQLSIQERKEIKDDIKENKDKIKKLIDANKSDYDKYYKNIQEIKENYKNTSLLEKANTTLNSILNSNGDENIKISKLKDEVYMLENDNFKGLKNLDLTKEDRFIFIGITFLIRLIALSFIEWSLNTNYVLNFTQAYLLYLTIYILLLLLIVGIVNITYNSSLIDTYQKSDNFMVKIASTLYYFYLIPGNRLGSSFRLIAHILLLGIITTIAILIKLADSKDNTSINFDYGKKKSIRNTLNNFTLVLWVFTSILAIKL